MGWRTETFTTPPPYAPNGPGATACNSGDDKASGPSASSSRNGDDKIRIPDAVRSKLKEHGIDIDQWKNGAWKNWDKDKWLSEAKDFVNPVITGLWKPERMKSAKDPDKTISAKDAAADQGVSDPEPAARAAGTATSPSCPRTTTRAGPSPS